MSDIFKTQELIRDFEPAFTPEILDRSLLIVGLGGNGTHIALAAVRMGFRSVVGVDCDVVSESNLTRQVLYSRQDVGRRKIDAAAESLLRHNLRSEIVAHHLDILQERRRFGDLVAAADMVFVVLDQPGPTFFAIDACYQMGKTTISGGTCALSGLSARVSWMGPRQHPCLNCAFATHPSVEEWVRFHQFDNGVAKEKTEAVERLDSKFRLEGGHPSTYPTACMGSNLMMSVGLNYLLGRRDMPRLLELSVLGPAFETRDLMGRVNCPTCGGGKAARAAGQPPHVGDRVRFQLVNRMVDGVVVEDRGPLGLGGRRLWGIEFHLEPTHSGVIELPEEDILPGS